MQIGIIYYGIYPWNRGIDQLAQLLKKIEITPYIATKINNSQKEEFINDIKVIPVFSSDSLKKFPFPFNPWWKNSLIELGSKYSWDAMLVRESILSQPVLAAAKELGIPAYLDMRENIAAMYKFGQAKNIFLKLLRNENIIHFYECKYIKYFKNIFTVSEELKTWLRQTYNFPADKVHILENTPSEQFLSEVDFALTKVKRPQDIIRLVYAGSIMKKKGIDCIINALPDVVSHRPNLRLRIIGDGRDLSTIKNMVHELSLEEVVEFLPMLSMKDLAKALAESHIGIESCYLNELTQQTVPGKLFEYMAAGLSVISSPRKPVIRILNETSAGKVFNSFNREDIAKTILEMTQHTDLIAEMGTKGRNAVLTRYNWKSNIDILTNTLFY